MPGLHLQDLLDHSFNSDRALDHYRAVAACCAGGVHDEDRPRGEAREARCLPLR